MFQAIINPVRAYLCIKVKRTELDCYTIISTFSGRTLMGDTAIKNVKYEGDSGTATLQRKC